MEAEGGAGEIGIRTGIASLQGRRGSGNAQHLHGAVR